jgi:hypothetical protein
VSVKTVRVRLTAATACPTARQCHQGHMNLSLSRGAAKSAGLCVDSTAGNKKESHGFLTSMSRCFRLLELEYMDVRCSLCLWLTLAGTFNVKIGQNLVKLR